MKRVPIVRQPKDGALVRYGRSGDGPRRETPSLICAWAPGCKGIARVLGELLDSPEARRKLEEVGADLTTLQASCLPRESVDPNRDNPVPTPTTRFVAQAHDALGDGLRQFGEYSFFDKGPSEVMDLGPLRKALRAMEPAEAANALHELLKSADAFPVKRAIPKLTGAVLGYFDGKGDWNDALWAALPEEVENLY